MFGGCGTVPYRLIGRLEQLNLVVSSVLTLNILKGLSQTVFCGLFLLGYSSSQCTPILLPLVTKCMGIPSGSVVKNPPANAGDMGSIPKSGRSSGEGNGTPLQHSCLENPMDRGAWRAAVHGAAEELDTSWQLNNNKTITKHTLPKQSSL